jgi:hypothetical protein
MSILRFRVGRRPGRRRSPNRVDPTPVTAPAPQAVERGDTPGLNIRWTQVNSSWIDALRFVPVAREGNRKYATGYVDMRVKGTGRRYRYGPGVKQENFNTWIVAASKGKYWWRYFTRRWSPATKL